MSARWEGPVIFDDAEPMRDQCMFWLDTIDPHTGNQVIRQCLRSAREGSAFCWQHFDEDGDL